MDFVTMLMEVQSGEAAMLADRKLQELVQAIRDTAGGGTLTLKMSVKRIAAIRESIAKIEAEECSCRLCRMCLDNDTACEHCGGTGTERNCTRCKHLDDLDAQLREAEGQDA